MPFQLKTYDLKEHDQVYFLHIPKTAGTTFKTILEGNFAPDRFFPYHLIHELLRFHPDELARFQLLAGHFFYSVHLLLPRKPIYLTVLRNPVERVISHYFYIRRSPEHFRYQKIASQSLLEFVTDPETRRLATNLQTRYLASDLDPRPIVATLTAAELAQLKLEWVMETSMTPKASDPDLLELAKKRLDEFAFIGLTERFQESASLLSYVFGWRPVTAIPPMNANRHRPSRKEIPDDTLEAISECNQLDVELYSYAETLFDSYLSQMYSALLDEHYTRRTILRNKPVRSVEIDFGKRVPGLGWHVPENIAEFNINFRWSGPGPLSTVDVMLSSQSDMVVEFRIVYAIAPDVLDSLLLTVNGVRITLSRKIDELSTTIFQGLIPRAVIAGNDGFCKLVFQINRTVHVQGNDPHGLDSRHLGLAFSWLRINPVGPSKRATGYESARQPQLKGVAYDPARSARYSLLMLSHNRLSLVKRCLDSLAPTLARDDVYLRLLDNGSTDGTAEWLQAWLSAQPDPSCVQLLLSPVNLGVAAGRQQLVMHERQEAHDVIVSLDSDVRIVSDNWLEQLDSWLTPAEVGLVGPDGYDVFWDRPIDPKWVRTPYGECDIVAGYCQAFKGELLNKGVDFDPEYGPFFHQDGDLCMQIRQQGYRILSTGDIGVAHVWGRSGVMYGDRARSFQRFRQKWYGKGLTRIEGAHRDLFRRDRNSGASSIVPGV
jgi:hypothetical protein